MELYPVFLTLRDRRCLVVGSGPYARNQAQHLSHCGAIVTLVCPNASNPMPGVHHIERRAFQTSDLEQSWLVVLDCNDDTLAQSIVADCERQNIIYITENNTQPGSALVTSVRPTSERPAMPSESDARHGSVALVGAGPGDPELLTLRALRLIQSASVVVHDRLVSKPIMSLCRQDARLIYAGKAKSDHALPQESINQLLVDLAQQGENVVRLKGGDPFIFGRGGEEIESLAEQQLPFEVVPGITAASGCSAFSGIPLTHRDHAQSCVFITGHLRSGEINLDWHNLLDATQTIVVYMGLTGLATICQALTDAGRDPNTKAALIERGTTPNQQVHTGTLTTLPGIVADSDVRAPTLLIIGGVVGLRGKLQWFEESIQ